MRSDQLVPVEGAALVLALMQVLVTWFILGNEDVLLRLTPVTVSGLVAGEALTAITPMGAQQTMRSARIVHGTALACLVAFVFVAAIGTARGSDPIGQPPDLTEWGITLGIVFVAALGRTQLSRDLS